MKLISLLFTILVSAGVLLIVFLILSLLSNQLTTSIAYEECCNGSICSDTYYTYKDNLCHLSLCEQSLLTSNCTYEGANHTLNLINSNKGVMK